MNAKNKQSAAYDDHRTQRGPIYVESNGQAHLLVDLEASEYRVVDESDEGNLRSASLKGSPEYAFRRFDMPVIFRDLSGKNIRFANPEHRRYEGKNYEPLLASEEATKRAEFEDILGDIRDVKGLHHIFSRIIPDIRQIVKASAPDYLQGIRNALCHRDEKTQSTLVSALYRFSYMPLARRVRDFAFSVGIAPYDPRELAAAKIEGYCRHFRGQYEGRPMSFDTVKQLCDRISSGAYADERNRAGESLFSVLFTELSERLNQEWAIRALDVLLNELTDVYDPKVDPIDPFQRDIYGRSVEMRILQDGDDEIFQRVAMEMLATVKSFFAQTAKQGRVTPYCSPPPPDVAGIRAKVAKGYSSAFR